MYAQVECVDGSSLVLVSPQCPDGEIWTDTDALMAMIESVQQDYRIDPQRIYLTGVSMGGRGVLYLAYRHPTKFAAVAALAPLSPITAWATGFGGTPILSMHGDNDTLAPISEAKDLVQAMQAVRGSVDFRILPGRDHSIADIYENDEIYNWLLGYRR